MKKYKKIFCVIIALLIIFFAVFFLRENNDYVLKGELKNCKECDLYLVERFEGIETVLDTIHANKNGKFKIERKAQDPTILTLRGKNDAILLLPMQKEKIKITADYENLATTYQISGSEESLRLKTLNDKKIKARFALKNMSEQLKETSQEDYDSVRNVIQQRFNLLMQSQREFLIGFINTNVGSLSTLVALYDSDLENIHLIDPIKDKDVYEKVLSGLKDKYPENKNTKFLEHEVLRLRQITTEK